MKRIVFDVPKWHVYLHRDARGLEIASDRDDPVRKVEDELLRASRCGIHGSFPPPAASGPPCRARIECAGLTTHSRITWSRAR